MKLKEQLQSLEKEKSSLLMKMNKLNEILLGTDEPENAKKISVLENEKSELIDELKKSNKKVKHIKTKIEELNKKIAQITNEEQLKKLFDHIKKTRWYFFENRKMFIFDKWNGLLWGNVENMEVPDNNDYINYKEALTRIEKIKWHNLDGWRLPEIDELPIKDEKLPTLIFQKSKSDYQKTESNLLMAFAKDNNSGYGCLLTMSGRYQIRSSKIDEKNGDAFYTPCNPKYKTDKFKPASVNEYINNSIEEKKSEDLVTFFIEQDWIPKFDDENIAKIFEAHRKKQQILKDIVKINKQLADLTKEANGKANTSDFNYQLLLKNYNLNSINDSALKFYHNSVKWINDLISKLDEFGNENSEFMINIQQIQIEMAKEYKAISDFTEIENKFFKKKHKEFQKIFDFDFDIIKQKLFEFREEAEEQLKIIENVSSEKNKIISLAKIENQERPDFQFFAEYTGEIVKKKLGNFFWYQEEDKNINLIISEIKEWFEDYQIFTDKMKNDFFKKCKTESIEKDVYAIWFEDWRKERFLIISKFFILISDSFNPKKISENVVLDILKTAKNYREQLDNFYKDERLNIHQKFAFQAGGELQEKFEKEMELSKITNEFTKSLQKIMFSGSSANKIFILRWANAWFDSQIEQIVLFAENSKLIDITPIFTEAMNELQKLKKQNMEVFLNDVKTFSKMIKKRNDGYNSLMFKMRKELMKSA